MSQVYRLPAQLAPSCPDGTKLVCVPRPAGMVMRLLVPDRVTGVVVIMDDDGTIGWIEDSLTGRGILDFVRPEPAA